MIDRQTGLLVEAGDAAVLAERILEIKEDDELSRRLALNGSKWVTARFDEREVARVAIEAYERCFDDGK